MTSARIHGSTWWQRMRSRLRAAIHRCRRCEPLHTSEGVGGRCVDCGRIHGWMTLDELMRVARVPHLVHLVSLPRWPGDGP